MLLFLLYYDRLVLHFQDLVIHHLGVQVEGFRLGFCLSSWLLRLHCPRHRQQKMHIDLSRAQTIINKTIIKIKI
ncbi:hypothetical protein Hanom_Chr01g00006521 [Helianthus anomalus]